ncbi:MAG: PAS domain S-box protein [Acidobacteriota bacterium]
MPNHSEPSGVGFAWMGRGLAQDAAWRWFAAAFAILHLPVLIPGLVAMDPAAYAETYLVVLLLAGVLLILLQGLASIERVSERQFWNYVTFAVFCWWLVRVLYFFVPPSERGTTVHLFVDGVYILFYIGLLLAVEVKPHLREEPGGQRSIRALESLGMMGLIFALLVYFVVIPSRYDPQAYGTWETSLSLYLLLDLILAIRFAQVARSCASHRWRVTYWAFCATAVLWGVVGILEILWRKGYADWLDAAWTYLLWQLPILTLVSAARLQHADSPVSVLERAAEYRRGSALGSGGFLAFAALMLPVLHLALARFGLLASEARAAQEWLVLGSAIVLGALMLAERAQLQQQSLEQNAHLASLIESTPLPIVLLDPSHRALTCNPAFESLFVYSRDEIIGRNIDDLITSEQSEQQAREITRRVLDGESTFSVSRRSRSDGRSVDVRIYGIPLKADGRLIGVFAIYQDLTERLRAERALKESEERFRLLSEAAFEGVVLSIDGTVIDANQQAADIYGFSIEEMIGAPIGSRVAEGQRELVNERVEAGYEQPYVLDCYRRDRTPFTIEVRGKTIPYKGGEARVTVVRDITETRRLEEQLRQSQKMEAIGRLAAGIAHDFNNLLTVILGHGSMLVKKLEAGTVQSEWANEIYDAAERAGKMVRQLLAFGRKQPLQFKVLDLNALVAGMETMLKRLIEADIALDLDLPTDTGWVKADPNQLEQVILNLALNARDAMPAGGRLTLTTAVQSIDQAAAREDVDVEPGDYLCLSVSDTGSGMDAETTAKIFEPFFTTRKKGGGSGLGLSTVHGIVKQSGGGITVESVLGQGTTFRIYLPKIL